MKLFSIHPEVHTFDSAAQFCAEMQIGKGDLVISNAYILHPAFDALCRGPTSFSRKNMEPASPRTGSWKTWRRS